MTLLPLRRKDYGYNLSSSSNLGNVFNIKWDTYFTRCFCFSFEQFTVDRFKLFQSGSQNSNFWCGFFILPSVAMFPNLSFSFILSQDWKKFIILLDNRAEQNNTSSHRIRHCFIKKIRWNSLAMWLEEQKRMPQVPNLRKWKESMYLINGTKV